MLMHKEYASPLLATLRMNLSTFDARKADRLAQPYCGSGMAGTAWKGRKAFRLAPPVWGRFRLLPILQFYRFLFFGKY
jgi:hypothetical protein